MTDSSFDADDAAVAGSAMRLAAKDKGLSMVRNRIAAGIRDRIKLNAISAKKKTVSLPETIETFERTRKKNFKARP